MHLISFQGSRVIICQNCLNILEETTIFWGSIYHGFYHTISLKASHNQASTCFNSSEILSGFDAFTVAGFRARSYLIFLQDSTLNTLGWASEYSAAVAMESMRVQFQWTKWIYFTMVLGVITQLLEVISIVIPIKVTTTAPSSGTKTGSCSHLWSPLWPHWYWICWF